MEEEIDLREYIILILNNWYWIAGLGFIAALITFIYLSFQPLTYQAEASIIILQSRTNISLEPKIETVVGDLTASRGSYQDTLRSLVTNNAVVVDVLAQVKDLLKPEQQTVSALTRKVDVNTEADLITIEVSDQDPSVAAQIANIWARIYETYINNLLGEGVNTLVEVETQSQDTATNHHLAQNNLEQFLETNPVKVLQRELEVKETQAQALKDVEVFAERLSLAEENYNQTQAEWESFLAVNTIDTLERDLATKEERMTALKNTERTILNRELSILESQADTLRSRGAELEQNPIFLWNLELENKRDILRDKYTDLKQVENWLDNAQALRDQIGRDSASVAATAGNALALIQLRGRVFAGVAAQSTTLLQVDLADFDSDSVTVADADALIEVLQARRQNIETDITELTQALSEMEALIELDPPSEDLTQSLEIRDQTLLLQTGDERLSEQSEALTQRIETLDEEIRALKSEIETQQAQSRELNQARDITWEKFLDAQSQLRSKEVVASTQWDGDLAQLSQALNTLDTEIQTLEAEIEAQNAANRELTQDRDLSWDNLTAIQRKVSEMQLDARITDSQIRVASQAIPPEDPVARGRVIKSLIAAVLGSMIALFGVFAFEYWRSGNLTSVETGEQTPQPKLS